MTEDALILPAAVGVRLILVRHGQTPSNVRHALDTLPPGPPLTEEGQRQAGELADRFDGEPVRSVHASRAVRAQETARPLAQRHALPVNVLDGMQEIYVGELEGTTDTESRQRFEDLYASWHFGVLDKPMPAGETGRQALTRFIQAVRQLVGSATGGTFVLVSHGAMLRFVAGHLTADVEAERANAAYLPNTGAIILEATPQGWHCLGWDGLPGS